jgi:aryl-alcohol dehydrogenase-like predicted oxidoreductase
MPELVRRNLGNTGMKTMCLGLGCAGFGGGNSSDQDAVEGVRRAIELGLDYVDTAPLYGQSERRVGLALEGGWREKIYLQTKMGMYADGTRDYSSAATRSSVENSLRLLKTDYFDAVLIHEPEAFEDAFAPPDRAIDELLKMKDEGLLRHIGIGTRSHDQHRRAIETGHIEIVLTYLDYTLVSQTVADTTLPLARERGVGIILASILGMGSLAGPEPPPDSRGDGGTALAMWQWCRDNSVNIRHLAMQFGLAAPVDGIVMAGPANKQQVEDAYEAATADIDPQIWRAFKAEFGVGI